MRYYIDNPNQKLQHIYQEYDMGIRWIATLTDKILANWLVIQLNGNLIDSLVPTVQGASKEEINKEE